MEKGESHKADMEAVSRLILDALLTYYEIEEILDLSTTIDFDMELAEAKDLASQTAEKLAIFYGFESAS